MLSKIGDQPRQISVFENHEELVEAIDQQIQQISQAWSVVHDGDGVETVFATSVSID